MSDHPVRRVSRFVRNNVWALTEDKLDAICEVIDARMRGITLTEAEIQARIGAGPMRGRETSIVNAVAVIPCYGVIARKMNMMTAISGGTSTDEFIGQVQQAVADPAIKAIVIDCDSPGGTVDGLIEAADALFALKGRGTKQIVAVANVAMASAAYWLLSQCDEIVGTPSAQVGSLGVFMVHEDQSAANAKAGLVKTYISAGKYKAEANEDTPLSDDARAYIQRMVDLRYNDFITAVARGRRVPVATVEQQYGQGRSMFAADALAAGLIDRIETLDATVSRLMNAPAPGSRLRGASQAPTLAASLPVIHAGVIPKDVSDKLAPKDTPWTALTLADFTDQPWDSLSTGEKRHIAGHFAWAASMPPESFGDLKLGHHRPSDGAVVFRGVTAALARLDQTKLPAGDAAKVKAHLEKHEAAFEKKDAASGAAPARPMRADLQDGDGPGDPDDDGDPETCDPDEHGDCPTGYAKGDDGLCHLLPDDDEDPEAQAAARVVDPKSRASLDRQQAEALAAENDAIAIAAVLGQRR